ncbi:MAG: insulinase family protein [Chroococcidiopsidaceae cyanobacterium CP_BM_ER_R8_30]|nr:insulinase family protein [Chroococcidiopsidaceae cyanobacterium CP_BM_ER_R8_30]
MSVFSSLRRYRFLLLLFGICLSAVLLFNGKMTATPSPAITPTLSVTEGVRKTVLENGLTVLTKEVHTAPVVSVQVWYRVGSRNEAPGLNGIAHQLEHLMFKGTTDRPIQFGRLFNALGSDSNAFTSYDETAYFDTVERNKLQAVLTLEADRMHNSLLGPSQLASEKRVVISELQGYENNPSYRLDRAVMRAAFPNQPYGLPVGGTKSDVEKFTPAEVQKYYETYYSPDNATLAIVGDFQTEPTIAAVKEIFGKVPNRGTAITPPSHNQQTIPASPAAKSPIVLRQPGSAPLLQEVYPLPSVNNPDVPILDVMDYILTGGRSSRLYQSLVQSGLAGDFGGGTQNLIAGGWYELTAVAAPGKSLAEIEQVLNQTVAGLQSKGVTTAELNRAKTQLRSGLILQDRDVTSQATRLANDQTVAGDYRYTDRYLAVVNRVTAAEVQRVAKKYLSPASRTVGLFEPTEVAGKPTGAAGATQTVEHFNLGPPVSPAEVAKYLPPVGPETVTTSFQELPKQFSLANGLKVLLLPDHSNPTVTLAGYVQAGTAFDSDAKAGLASLTAENLMNGTKTKDALAIAQTLANRGADLGFSAGREGVTIAGYALATDLPVLVQVLDNVLQNATFPNNEFELSQQRALTALQVQLDNPKVLAQRTFQQAIYPDTHPFHSFPTAASLKNISRADLVQFYQKHYQPENTVLTLLGDFEPNQVQSLLEQQLGKWQVASQSPQLNYPPVPLPAKTVHLQPVLPGKTEAVTFMGYRGIGRNDPRYYAAEVLNQIVGGNTLASQLGTEIRDRLGLTYGIYSSFQAGRHAGPFLIEMQTAPEDAQRAISSTITLLKQIHQQGVTMADVEAAKRSIVSDYIVSLASPDNIASITLMNQVDGLGIDELRQFPEQIQSVTLAQVNQADQELIQPNNLVIVTVGPPGLAAQSKE